MTINEIAHLAGVSRATVSRYLNNGYVSEEKKEKIQKVIEETGYVPSSQAQMLRTKKTKLIGVILPKISSSTISRMTAGISDVITKYGYMMLLANTNNDEKEELKYLQLFRDNQVDGIIFIATVFTKKHIKLLKECKVPVVILGQRLSGYSCVYQDDYNASFDITSKMIEKGKKIGYIGVIEKDEAAGKNRKKGFIDALKHSGIEIDTSLMFEGGFNIENGYENMKLLFEKAPDIDSVFCATDTVALGALTYIKEKNIKVPEQIQIVGTGDTPMGEVVEPKLSTVHFYYKTSGSEAGKTLMDILETGENVKKEIKMGYEIVLRESIR